MRASPRCHPFLLFVILASTCPAAPDSQTTFRSPNAAANALLAAVRSGDYAAFLSIAGRAMSGFWSSGDGERDGLERDLFVDAARKWDVRNEAPHSGRKLLCLGSQAVPVPAPLVYTGSGWRFDGDAGLAELTARRIIRNEDAIVTLSQRFREAEFLYAGTAWSGGRSFASKIRSTPGKRDGLFWTGEGEEDESPLGPGFAAAAYEEQEPGEQARPLFGYYLKVLTAQGADANGGELDYVTDAGLRKGFALIVWPAEYGVGGIRSFMINQLGYVYQKDLGPETAHVAESMAVFNPDASWRRLDPRE